MKNKKLLARSTKLCSVITAVSMLFGMTGCGTSSVTSSADAVTDTESVDDVKTESSGKTDEEKLSEKIGELTSAHSAGKGKDETVYVISSADGSKKSVIVSDHLKNGDGKDTLEDKSELKDITNVNGYETFKKGSDGKLTWDAKGSDIYYQGTTDKELPVDVKITYLLDGKEVTPDEIAGKSGKVTIRFDYTNNTEKTVKIGGKDEKIKVPFSVISGVILPIENFDNVTVTNGRIISEGKNNIVVGLAFPGLKESINLDDLKNEAVSEDAKKEIDDIDIPDYVEITADAKNFKIDTTMTVAQSNLLSSVNLTQDVDTKELTDKMDELQDGADKLQDGAGKLKDGTESLTDGTEKLKDGSGDLKDGTKKLAGGTDDLKDGADKLKDGSADLKDGTKKLADGTDDLSSGVSQLKDGSSKLAGGTDKLSSGASQLKDGTSQLSGGLKTLKNGTSQLKAGTDQLSAAKPQLDQSLKDLQNMGTQLNDAKNGSAQISDGIGKLGEALTAKFEKTATNMKAMDEGVQKLSAGIGQAANGIKELQTKFDSGVGGIQKQVKQLIADLKDYSTDEASGITGLGYRGIGKAAYYTSINKAQQAAKSANDTLQKAQETVDKAQKAYDEALKAQQNSADAGNSLQQQNDDLAKKNAKLQQEIDELQNSADQEKETNDAASASENSAASSGSAAANTETQSADSAGSKAAGAAPAETPAQNDAAVDASAQSAAPADNTSSEDTNAGNSAADTTENVQSTQASLAGLAVSKLNEMKNALYESTVLVAKAGEISESVAQAQQALETAKESLQTAQRAKVEADATVSALKDMKSSVDSAEKWKGDTNDFKRVEKMTKIMGEAEAINSSLDILQKSVDEALESLSSGLGIAKNGLDTIHADLDASLNSDETKAEQQQLNDSLAALKGGADQLTTGLGSGLQQLTDKSTATTKNIGDLKNGIDQLSSGANSLDDGAGKLAAGAEQADNGAGALAGGIQELGKGAHDLDNGIGTLKSGASDLQSGAHQLDDGAGDLNDGIIKLDNGAGDLQKGAHDLDDGTQTLIDGINSLNDGAHDLDDGMATLQDGVIRLNEEGIRKLTDLFGDNVQDVIDRINAVVDAGDDYTSFAGTGDQENSAVKFIYKTDAVKAKED